jgi:hypothetical protein
VIGKYACIGTIFRTAPHRSLADFGWIAEFSTIRFGIFLTFDLRMLDSPNATRYTAKRLGPGGRRNGSPRTYSGM